MMPYQDYKESEKLCLLWILSSGIYDHHYNALNHSYDAIRKKYNILYTESTGYAIKYFINNYKWNNDERFLKLAILCSKFIEKSFIGIDKERGLFSFGYNKNNGSWSKKAYSFDTAVCISSLIDLSKEIDSKEVLNRAINCSYFLIDEAKNENGSFKACFDTESNQFIKENVWFGDEGCLHAKIGISIFKSYEVTNDSVFKKALHSLMEWILSFQMPYGAFVAKKGENYVFTHSHCYVLETLAYLYRKSKNPSYLYALLRGINWLLKVQKSDGGFYEFYGIPRIVPWIRSDATAQACRLFTIAHLITNRDSYYRAALRAASFIISNQIISGDIKTHGGFYSRKWGLLKWPELTSWGAMFAGHAMHMLCAIHNSEYETLIDEIF